MTEKPTPKWGYVDYLEITPFNFSSVEKSEILDTLGIRDRRNNTDAPFLEELEKQIAEFRAYNTLETEQPRRSEILAALKALDTSADPLAAMLNSLDSQTRRNLIIHLPPLESQTGEHGWHTDNTYLDYVEFISHALGDLRQAIDLTRKDHLLLPPSVGGRPKQWAHRTFALNVAIIFQNHTGISPTATKEGPYESILGICITAATGKSVEDVHELACEVLRMLKEEEPPLK
jgi:hypothetical protein